MLVSQIVKENFITDSQSYKDLSPIMKEAVNDIFKVIEKEQGNIITKLENAIAKIAKFHNVDIEKINEYFDKEILEQLGEK
jgi:TRAP-type C4-dicarboxylate transport system substrate-binding protein